MERALISEITNLNQQLKLSRRDAVDLGELKQQMEKEEKVMRRAAEKIEILEIERDAPSRITASNKDETGKPLAML